MKVPSEPNDFAIVVTPEITPRFLVLPSPKFTVTFVIGCGGLLAGVTVNEIGTPIEPVVTEAAIVMVGNTRVTTNAIDAEPRWAFRSMADAVMV